MSVTDVARKYLAHNILPQDLGKVGVLMGGRSAERKISLMSGNSVWSALKQKGVNAHAFDMGKKSLQDLAQAKFDRVFIALHGRWGEDGCIQGALELLGILYTGAGVMASAIAMRKEITKQLWQHINLPIAKSLMLSFHSCFETVAKEVGLPLVVKPASEGSTLGFTKVDKWQDIEKAFIKARKYSSLVMAEQFIDGEELTCAILESESDGAFALSPVLIRAPGGNYDYHNKYFDSQTRYFCPTGLVPEVEAEIADLSLKAYRAIDCRGWGRVDVMRRGSDNALFLLEINTAPGMTAHSLVPIAAAQAGCSYADLCLYLLAQARCYTSQN